MASVSFWGTLGSSSSSRKPVRLCTFKVRLSSEMCQYLYLKNFQRPKCTWFSTPISILFFLQSDMRIAWWPWLSRLLLVRWACPTTYSHFSFTDFWFVRLSTIFFFFHSQWSKIRARGTRKRYCYFAIMLSFFFYSNAGHISVLLSL